MSLENSFTKIPKEGLPLQEFLGKDHTTFASDPEQHLSPLVDYLLALHESGETHGAILPSCMVVSQTGEIDLVLLNSRRGYPEKSELPIYYPQGEGSDLVESKLRDIQALAAILHLIVTDQPPSRRDRRPLQENSASRSWPPLFIQVIDRMLVGDATLPELAASLSSGVSSESIPAAAPIPELPLAPVPVIHTESPKKAVPLIRLPNAMVGREFSAELILPEGFAGTEFQQIDAFSEIPAGLVFQGKSLVGTPEKAGDFEIRVSTLLTGKSAGSLATEFLLILMVNPDPRSLWKNLPSERSDPFWKPDSDGQWISNGPLAVVGASLRGRSHAHVGSFRDDDLAMDWMPEVSWYSLIVVDGAGSAQYSRRGSQIACQTVKAHLRENLCNSLETPLAVTVSEWATTQEDPAAKSKLVTALYNLLGQAVFAARNAIDKEAAELKAASRDFHTTLITSLVHPMENGAWFIATFSIGDGAAAVVGAPGGVPCLLTRPDGGEFAGQTVFLTMKETLATTDAVMGRISFHIVPDFKALFLVTDGISDPRFDSDASLADPTAWESFHDEIIGVLSSAPTHEQAASALVDWMAFHSPGHHDDRTVILAKPSGK